MKYDPITAYLNDVEDDKLKGVTCKTYQTDGTNEVFTKFGIFVLPRDLEAYLDRKIEWEKEQKILNEAMRKAFQKVFG